MRILLILIFMVFNFCKEKSISPEVLGMLTSQNSGNFTVGGSVSSLSGTLQISLNSSETLSISQSGFFTFQSLVSSNSSYNVSVVAQPSSQYCSISNGSGIVSGNIDSIIISCTSGNANGALVGGTIFNPLTLGNTVTTVTSGAALTRVNGISTDGTYIYLTAETNHTILKLNPVTASVTVLAGLAGASGNVDAIGTSARFNRPMALVYLNSFLYITDYTNNSIRKLDLSNNQVTTIATGVSYPYGITTDGTYLYYTEKGRVTKLKLSDNSTSVLAGAVAMGYVDGTGASARFNPTGNLSGAITYDGSNLYVIDRGNCSIRKVIISTGVVTTVFGSPPPTAACGTITDGVGTASRLGDPDGIVSDGTNLYFAESTGNVIRKVTLSTSTISSIAGLAGSSGMVDGVGTAARFTNPAIMASDGVALYVTDWSNNAVRKIQ